MYALPKLSAGATFIPGAANSTKLTNSPVVTVNGNRYRGNNYVLDGGRPFLGEVISLEPCQSTHVALSLLPYKPTLKGEMKIQSYLAAGNWTQEN